METSKEALCFGVTLLAAGRSTRMGRPKLLLPWHGTTVVGHLLECWHGLGAQQVAVVCATNDVAMQSELDRLGFPTSNRIYNPTPELGMFSSIQIAAHWTGWAPDLTHLVIALGDQPHLKRQTLVSLLDFARSHPGQVCQPVYQGHPRHPVILSWRLLNDLRASQLAHLKAFLSGRERALCDCDDPGLDLDLDHPEDYEKALAISAGGG